MPRRKQHTAVASAIADQLTHARREGAGFGSLVMMLGAKLVYDDNSLSVRFKGNPKVNHCKIALTGDDLYTVEFWQVRGANVKQLAKYEGVYDEGLRPLFESTTGLYTSLR